MANVTKIHAGKTPHRIHFIAEWAEKRGIKAARISERTEVDKGTVSKWFGGQLPSEKNLLKVAAALDVEPNDLFRHPDDDWLARFLQGRQEEERERIRATLEAAFPRKVG